MKKTLSILLSFIMLLSITAGLDFSASAATSGDYEYCILDDGTVEITKYNGTGGYERVPSTIDGYTVTRIGYEAFFDCTSLTSVTIPDSVTSIGDVAFRYCSALTSIMIPDSVISIGNEAFSDCTSLTSIMIPDSVANIGAGAFSDCTSLTSVMIPDSVINIGPYTCFNCKNLVNITIPHSIISIGKSAFRYCINLTDIYYSFTMDDWNVISIGDHNEELINATIHCTDGVINQISGDYKYTVLNDNYIRIVHYNGTDSDIVIPKMLDSYIVKEIGEDAFCELTEDGAYGYDFITSVYIPDSVETIYNWAFVHCENLKSVRLSVNLKNLYNGVFEDCHSLNDIVLPESLEYIGMDCFSYCENLTSINIPKKVNYIGSWAFCGCLNLSDVYYDGTKAQWSNINIGSGNDCLLNSNIYCTDGTICKEHNWNNGVLTKSATCTAIGAKKYTCTKCGETKTETIAKKAHTYKTTTTKATTKKNGSVVTKCTVCGNISKNTTIYYPKTITLSTTSYTYNGKAKKPTVTVKDSKGNKIASSNYTVTYQSGRKNVGKYTVTIKFKGNYSGTVTKTFTIKPKSTSISKATAKKKGFTVKWKKQATQTTGYEIQYATDSKFTKNKKTVTVSKNKTTSKTISKLKAKKKYYVRIRTYKTVKVNGKNTKIYSSWSKAKAVTTKK